MEWLSSSLTPTCANTLMNLSATVLKSSITDTIQGLVRRRVLVTVATAPFRFHFHCLSAQFASTFAYKPPIVKFSRGPYRKLSGSPFSPSHLCHCERFNHGRTAHIVLCEGLPILPQGECRSVNRLTYHTSTLIVPSDTCAAVRQS